MMLSHFRGKLLISWIPTFAGMTQFWLMDNLGLRILSNALCLVHKLLIPFTGHAKFVAVFISPGYLRQFVGLHDEYVLIWMKYSYVVIPNLQLFHTHLVEARNSAQRVTFTNRVSNSISSQLTGKGRVSIKCLEFIFCNLTIQWHQ